MSCQGVRESPLYFTPHPSLLFRFVYGTTQGDGKPKDDEDGDDEAQEKEEGEVRLEGVQGCFYFLCAVLGREGGRKLVGSTAHQHVVACPCHGRLSAVGFELMNELCCFGV